MIGILGDLQHALRLYVATPLSSAVAVVVLAIALAFFTALFSLWNDLALAPHPGVARGHELVSIMQHSDAGTQGLSYDLVEAMNADPPFVTAIAGIASIRRDVRIDGERVTANVERVTQAYFPVVRPKMRLGRPLQASDHQADAELAAVLSYRFWVRHFGADPNIIGHELSMHGLPVSINIDGETTDLSETLHRVRIVGVMAPAMRATFGGRDTDLWLAYEPDQAVMEEMMPFKVALDNMTAVARLNGRAKGSAKRRALEAELNRRHASALTSVPGGNGHRRIQVHSGLINDPSVHRETVRQVALFSLAGGLVLLVAAASTSLFLLSRTPARSRELGIRLAVGATRLRLARQLICEATVIVVIALLLGLVLSLWLAVWLKDLPFLQGARWRDLQLLDWRVLATLASAAVAVTAAVALAPVWSLWRLGIVANTRRISARPRLSQRLAGLVQIALSGMLGGAALALGWHMLLLYSADAGFDPSKVVIVAPKTDHRQMFRAQWDQILTLRASRRSVLEQLPGVEQVGFGHPVPTVIDMSMSMSLPRASDPKQSFSFVLASIDAMLPVVLGQRLLFGRLPKADEPNEVLINESFARGFWGRSDVVGEVIDLSSSRMIKAEGDLRVIGVLHDTAMAHPMETVQPTIYTLAHSNAFMDLVLLRTGLSPQQIRNGVEEKIRTSELDFELDWVEHMSTRWYHGLAADRSRMQLTLGSAALVLMLAGFGFFGTQRYLVSAGRREYGIHAAHGADPNRLALLVVTRGLQLGLPGIVIGSLLALIVTAELRETLINPDISPLTVSVLTALMLLALLTIASAGPARRVRSLSPSQLLRKI